MLLKSKGQVDGALNGWLTPDKWCPDKLGGAEGLSKYAYNPIAPVMSLL